ncbi:MAG: hypothetical protein AAFQ08_00420, partial [Bacteroidota bacterium]
KNQAAALAFLKSWPQAGIIPNSRLQHSNRDGADGLRRQTFLPRMLLRRHTRCWPKRKQCDARK